MTVLVLDTAGWLAFVEREQLQAHPLAGPGAGEDDAMLLRLVAEDLFLLGGRDEGQST